MYPNNYIPTSDGLAALRPPLCPQRGGKDYFIVLQNKRPVSVHAHTTRLSDLEVRSYIHRAHLDAHCATTMAYKPPKHSCNTRTQTKRPAGGAEESGLRSDCVCSLLNAKMDSQVYNLGRRALHQTQCAQQSTSFRPARAKDT
jgi:hypothetical protein